MGPTPKRRAEEPRPCHAAGIQRSGLEKGPKVGIHKNAACSVSFRSGRRQLGVSERSPFRRANDAGLVDPAAFRGRTEHVIADLSGQIRWPRAPKN